VVLRDITGGPIRFSLRLHPYSGADDAACLGLADVSSCFYLASLGGTEPGIGARGHISVNAIASSNRSVYVLTSAKSAINADRAFTLLIRC
jgi:hypothetical protein